MALTPFAGRPQDTRLPHFGDLTERERFVLAELMEGHCAEEIAHAAFVSVSTVRSQIKAILQKLGVSSQLAAVALARRAGWSLDSPAENSPSSSTRGRLGVTTRCGSGTICHASGAGDQAAPPPIFARVSASSRASMSSGPAACISSAPTRSSWVWRHPSLTRPRHSGSVAHEGRRLRPRLCRHRHGGVSGRATDTTSGESTRTN